MKIAGREIPIRTIVQLVLVIGVLPMAALLISWRWNWWEAWAYALLASVGFIVSRWLAVRHSPDLLEERARSLEHTDVKPWDRTLAPLTVLSGVLIPIVAGLSARFGWSTAFGLPARLLALAAMVAGYAFVTWALVENRFFSGVVRIQTERGHQVVSTGPYAWLRHPGYAGALLANLATPILLSAPWAYLACAVASGAVVVRTALEDRTLQEELPGYRDYAGKVRYRLLPGVW